MAYANPYGRYDDLSGRTASEAKYLEQEKQRMMHHIQTVVHQELKQARIMSGTTTEMGETVTYDHNTMTYKTSNQEREIKELRKQIEEKKAKKEKNLKDLIAYYYRK